MTGITELDQRLEFLELRVQDREIVRQFFPVLRPHLVGILEQFYDKLRRIPHLAAMFGEGARQAAICGTPRKHKRDIGKIYSPAVMTTRMSRRSERSV